VPHAWTFAKEIGEVNINLQASRHRSGFVTNEWLIVAGILAVIVGVALALPGKWSAIIGIPLLGLFGLSLFMSWLDDPARIAKKEGLRKTASESSAPEKPGGEQDAAMKRKGE